jgi:DNA-binding beta-propeller fold protein YncE
VKRITQHLSLLTIFFLSCAGDPLFTGIGGNIAEPIAIAIDAANSRAYVVNSNLGNTYTGGSFNTFDITNPESPSLLSVTNNPLEVSSLSGQIYFDAANNRVLFTNRESDNDSDEIDNLFEISVDESGGYGAKIDHAAGKDPFGIACCDTSNNLYVISSGTLRVFPLGDLTTSYACSLQTTLDSGSTLLGNSSTRITILNDILYITNRFGFIYVIDTTAIPTTSTESTACTLKNLIKNDAAVLDFRGIATDGTLVYVIDRQAASQLWTLDPANLPTDREVELSAVQKTGLAAMALGDTAAEIIYFAATTRLYVSNELSDTVSVINVADTNAIAAETAISLTTGAFTGDRPFGLAAATLGATDYLYVTNIDSDNISIVDLSSNTVVANYP